MAATLVVTLRLSILLPAIAVDAPDVTPALALSDTKGYVLRIFGIVILAAIPWLAAAVAGTELIGRQIHVIGSLPAMIGLVMFSVLQTVMLSLFAVILSLVFIALRTKTGHAVASPMAIGA
jgi:hypothetical protein